MNRSMVAHALIGAAAFAAAVPEPETYALFAFGLLTLALRRRVRPVR